MVNLDKKMYVIKFNNGLYWCGYNTSDKQLRKAKKLSQKELAEKLGINEITLYRKINNDGFFTRKEINTMIDFLAIENPAEIFFAEKLAETKE